MPFQPQTGADQLVPHQHRFEWVGGPGPLKFPPLCPNCGSAAHHTLSYTKVFYGRSGDDWMDQRELQHIKLPFCAVCVAHHEAAVWRPSLVEKALSLASENLLAALCTGAVALFLLKIMPGMLPQGRIDLGSLFPVGLFVLFALISWALLRQAWRDTAHKRVPAQTGVTAAIDFSDDISKPFEPARYVYTVRDAVFATAFDALNPGKGWQAQGPAALVAERKHKRLMWLGLAALIAFALWDLLGGAR